MNFSTLYRHTFLLLLAILKCATINIYGSDQKSNELMKAEAKLVTEMIEVLTPQGAKVGPGHGEKVIDTFLNELDPLRLYVTEKERTDVLKKHANSIWQSLRDDGDQTVFYELIELYQKAIAERQTWIDSILAGKFIFKSNETYNLERSSRPKNKREADKEWTARLKHDLLLETLQGVEREEAKQLLRKRYSRVVNQAASLSGWKAHELILSAILKASDSGSTYFSDATLKELESSFPGAQIGIGATLNEDENINYISIGNLLPGGPAALSGKVLEGDTIISVQQAGDPHPFDAALVGMKELTRHTAGPLNSELTITVASKRFRDEPRKTVSLRRSRPPAPRVSAYTTLVQDKDGKIVKVGIIDVPSFYLNQRKRGAVEFSMSKDLKRVLETFKEEQTEACVIDLRKNEGGLFDEAINACGLFVSDKPVVAISKPSKKPYPINSSSDSISLQQPVVILTSRKSAAASEIFAGVLKHYGKAIIIGDGKTAGAGSIHQVFSLEPYIPNTVNRDNPAGMVKLTIGAFLLPNGRSVSPFGIQPDILIESLTRSQPKTIPSTISQKIQQLASATPIAAPMIEELDLKSKERRKAQDAYQHLLRYREWLIEQQPGGMYSLNQEQRAKDQTRNITAQEKFSKELESIEGYKLTIQPISINALDKSKRIASGPVETVLIDYPLKEAANIAADAISLWNEH